MSTKNNEADAQYWQEAIFEQFSKVAEVAAAWWSSKDTLLYSEQDGVVVLDEALHLYLRIYTGEKVSAVKGFRCFPILEAVHALPTSIIHHPVPGGYRRAVAACMDAHPIIAGLRLIYKQNLTNTCQSRGFIAFVPNEEVQSALYLRIPPDAQVAALNLYDILRDYEPEAGNMELKHVLINITLESMCASLLQDPEEICKKIWAQLSAPRTDVSMPKDFKATLDELMTRLLILPTSTPRRRRYNGR